MSLNLDFKVQKEAESQERSSRFSADTYLPKAKGIADN